jgi:Zn finger protein HypA/HybF involved in hydrogenase expression
MREYNIKPRKVKCPKCLIIVVSDQPKPTCKLCGSNMIKIVKFILEDYDDSK